MPPICHSSSYAWPTEADAWEICPQRIELDKQIGCGCFVEVYVGTLATSGEYTQSIAGGFKKKETNDTVKTVAVKVLNGTINHFWRIKLPEKNCFLSF